MLGYFYLTSSACYVSVLTWCYFFALFFITFFKKNKENSLAVLVDPLKSQKEVKHTWVYE